MLVILATGKLIKDPVKRTSASGKPYCTLLLSAPTNADESVLVNCIAFADVAERLLKLSKDDSVTLLGKAKCAPGSGMVSQRLAYHSPLTKRSRLMI